MSTAKIKFNPEIVVHYGYTNESLLALYQELASILKNKFETIVPTNINGTIAMDNLIDLHKIFTTISSFEGFERHLKLYDENDINPNLFVAKVAFALSFKAREICLEPEVTSNNGRNPDLEFQINKQKYYAECKIILTEQFNYINRHREIFSLLNQYLEYPHQISFFYQNELSNDEINAYGESIKKMIPKVNRTGKIINNKNVEVDIQLRQRYDTLKIQAEMDGLIENNTDGNRLPMHVFYQNGRTVSIAGPQVDFSNIIINKINSSRTQCIDGFPFITILNTDLFLGQKNENLRSVHRLFQPERNTRISGVLFCDYQSLRKQQFESLIVNPYSINPIDEITEHLLTK